MSAGQEVNKAYGAVSTLPSIWLWQTLAALGESVKGGKNDANDSAAVVATVGDFNQFKNGAQFGAWLGLTPRQNSSGGKSNLGGITKRGDMYLRMLLIQGAKSAVMTAHKRDDPISKWLHQLREKSGWQKAAVAMANKNARILWAMMTKGCRFDAQHVSVKPAGLAPVMA